MLIPLSLRISALCLLAKAVDCLKVMLFLPVRGKKISGDISRDQRVLWKPLETSKVLKVGKLK